MATAISPRLSWQEYHLAPTKANTNSEINTYATVLLAAHSGPIAAVVLENSAVASAKYVPIADTEYSPYDG